MPVPSNALGTAVLGSVLPSRNSRAIIANMGRIISPKAISASTTCRVLAASRNSAFTSAKQSHSSGLGRDPKAVAHAVKRLDHITAIVNRSEFPA